MYDRDTNEQNKSSAWSVVFNICCIAIGLGVLSFPFAFRCAGLIGGLILCGVCALVTTYCMSIIIKHATKHGCNTFQDLVKCSLGNRFSWGVALLVIVYLYGSCVAYQIVVGDTFHLLIAQLLGSTNSVWADRRLIIAVTGLFIVLPISLKRSAFHFAGVSSVAVLVIVFMGVIVTVRAVNVWRSTGLQNVELFVWRPDIIYALPIIIFAFQAHVQSCNLFFELDDNSRLFGGGARESTRVSLDTQEAQDMKMITMYSVVKLSFSFCTIVFASVGVAGYSLQPKQVGSDIMGCLPQDDILIQVVRGLVGLSALLHYPINQHVGRAALDDFVANLFDWPTSKLMIVPYWRVAACTLAFFVPCTVTAILVTDLGIVFHLLGGIASACFIFIIPGFMILIDSHSHIDIEAGVVVLVSTPQQVLQKDGHSQNKNPEEAAEFGKQIELQIMQLENSLKKHNETTHNEIHATSLTEFQRSFSDDLNFYRSNSNNSKTDQIFVNKLYQNEIQVTSQFVRDKSNRIKNQQTILSDTQNKQQQLVSYLSLPLESSDSSSFTSISDFKSSEIYTATGQLQNLDKQYQNKTVVMQDRGIQIQETQLQKRIMNLVGIVLIIFGISIVTLTVFTTLLEVFDKEGNGWPTRPRAAFPCLLH